MKKVSLFVAAIFSTTLSFGAGEVGSQAFEFAKLTNMTGDTVNMASYRGKVIFLMTVQYNCAGCLANAPLVGKIADSIGALFPGKMQAVGVDINLATVTQLGNMQTQLRSNAPNVNFPLMRGITRTASADNGNIRDSVAGTTTVGTLWNQYNALRDVFFVIDHTGKITTRANGNRSSATTTANLNSLRSGLTAALTAAPTPILCLNSCKNGLKASRQNGGFHFNLNSSNGPVLVQILDLQGRNMRTFSISASASEAVWNGRDAFGNSIPYGTYFLRASGSGFSSSQRISWQP